MTPLDVFHEGVHVLAFVGTHFTRPVVVLALVDVQLQPGGRESGPVRLRAHVYLEGGRLEAGVAAQVAVKVPVGHVAVGVDHRRRQHVDAQRVRIGQQRPGANLLLHFQQVLRVDEVVLADDVVLVVDVVALLIVLVLVVDLVVVVVVAVVVVQVLLLEPDLGLVLGRFGVDDQFEDVLGVEFANVAREHFRLDLVRIDLLDF